MFDVLRDVTDIAWLNAIAIVELVAIDVAEVAGVMATIAGADAYIVAPVVNWDWNEDVSATPDIAITLEATCTLYEV
jgi:hypothetical protein